MDIDEKLKRAFKELINAKPNLPVPGVVTATSGDTCSVQISGGLVLTDVKLKATISNDGDYLLLTPKVGSNVLLMSLTGNMDNMAIIISDQIQKIEYSQNGLLLQADSEDSRIRVKNDHVSLTEIFSSLGTILRELKFFTNSGVSGLPIPTCIAAIDDFETKFKQLLKDD